MGSVAPPSLADRIYEAAVVPEFWPDVLGHVTGLTEGWGSLLFSLRGPDLQLVGSSAEMNQLAAEYFARFAASNERTRRLLSSQHAGFVTDSDVFSAAERETEPVFRDFLTPRGYGNGVATVINLPNGDRIVFHTEGRHSSGPVSRAVVSALDRIRPDLARAALLSARLSFERARTAVETLSALGLAACGLGHSGTVLVANDEFDAEQNFWTTRAGDRIALFDQRANGQLHEAIGGIAAEQGIRSIPLFSRASRQPAVLHLVPVRRSAHDIFSQAAAILVLTRPVNAPTGATSLIQALFDLSPVEAGIASRIAAGITADEIAAADGKSPLTVRTQLKSVLAKTGCQRQVDLARLLARLIPPGAGQPA